MDLNIGNNFINKNSSTYFVAEIGSNFDGDLNRAINLIKLAKKAGANAAKFQHYTANSLVSDAGFSKLNLNSHQKNWKKSVFETYDKASLNVAWTSKLADECKKQNLDFMTSPYSFDLLEKTIKYMPAIKIGSGDITYHELIKRMIKFEKPILLATGASNMKDVESAMKIIYGKVPVCIMQCNTNYEANKMHYKDQNLNVLKTYKEIWPKAQLGLSCHMKTNLGVIAAVTMGARIIEKHFTDDNSRQGPDHKFALDFNEFKEMVDSIRSLEKMLGDGHKKIEDNEKSTYFLQRRSLVVKKDLKKGDILQEDNIEALRPYFKDGFEPYCKDFLLGKTIKEDIAKGNVIKSKYI